MSENRPERPWGDPAAGNDHSEDGQYASPSPSSQPTYPGTPDQTNQPDSSQPGYPSYGQPQDSYPGYGQQTPAAPYGDQSSYPGYGQETSAPVYGQPSGYPAYGMDGYPQPRPNPGQAMGIAGLITSFFFSVVGLVLSIVGLNQSRKAGMSNTPAVIGIVVGGLGTALTALFVIFMIIAVASSPY